MAKTIIQTIGPLYGEVVNGTVFGRPNGSIYVPPTNTIAVKIEESSKYIKLVTQGGNTRLLFCDSSGQTNAVQVIAESQDVQSFVELYIEDSDEQIVGVPFVLSAGMFNFTTSMAGRYAEGATIEDEADYTVHVTLCSANGVPVATTTINVKGVSI